MSDAERRRSPAPLLSGRRPCLTVQDAYEIQWCGARLRIRGGARVVGYKVGLTSQAMQQQFGIDEPDSGILLDCMQIPTGQTLRTHELLAPRVEAEIAVRLGQDLDGNDVTADRALAAVAHVCLALEVIDSRYGFTGLTLADSVADNAACARFALGEAEPAAQCDLRAERVAVYSGTPLVATGQGSDVLGDPIRSVVWLAQHLAGRGRGLRGGDVVLTGAVHASFPVTAGEIVAARSDHLPSVRLPVA